MPAASCCFAQYHYPKYVKKALTNILARKVVNYGPDAKGKIHVEREWKVTSSSTSPFANLSQRVFDFDPGNCNKVTGRFGLDTPDWPGCVPPYRDYHHFTGSDKPWMGLPNRNVWVLNRTAFSSTQLWWQMVRKLKEEDGIDITQFGFMLEKASGKNKKGGKGNV